MKKRLLKQPVLVFLSDDDEVTRYELSSAARAKNIKFYYLERAEEALEAAIGTATIKSGLFVLKSEFARGYDIRFACGAYVCIYSEDRFFSPSTIE